MPLDLLDALETQAIDTAHASGRIEDIEKAASICKQIAESRKAKADGHNQPRLLRYEEFKAWATILVPFLTVATLAVTVFIQVDQLKATREANKDTEWREAEKNVLAQVNRPQTVVADPALAMSLLEPYVSDERHGRDATLLAIHLLSSVPTANPFQDFFASHHIGEKVSDLDMLIATNRQLATQYAELENRLKALNHEVFLEAVNGAILKELAITSSKICPLLHLNSKENSKVQLEGLFLFACDLSGLRFDGSDLSGARFEGATLKDVYVGPSTKTDGLELVDSDWWDARHLPKALLQQLTNDRYPYYDPENVYAFPPPQKEDYLQRVNALCKAAELPCKPSELKYGNPSATVQSQGKNASGKGS